MNLDMLVGESKDIVTSQSKLESRELGIKKTKESEPFTIMRLSSSDNQIHIEGHNQEDVSVQGSGRSSVVSDPGYISCAGSDRSSVHSFTLGGETDHFIDDYSIDSSNQYNAVLSPCNTSIADVLNDTYIANPSLEGIFNPGSADTGQELESMSPPLTTQSKSDQTAKLTYQRTRTLSPASTSTLHSDMTTSTSHASWSRDTARNTMQGRSRSSDEIFYQQSNFNFSLDGDFDTKCTAFNNSTSQPLVLTDSIKCDASPTVREPALTYTPGRTDETPKNQYLVPPVTTGKSLSVENFSLSVEDFCFEDDMVGGESTTFVSSLQDNCAGSYSPVREYSNTSYHRDCNYNTPVQASCKRTQDISCPGNKNITIPCVSLQNNSMVSCNRKFSHSGPAENVRYDKTSSVMTSNSDTKPRFTAAASSEEEAWRTYLENPLTAATTAIMSIHGDEDSAAALGLLYDYYKVPREKRLLSYQVHGNETTQKTFSSLQKVPGNSREKNALSSTLGSENLKGLPRYAKSDHGMDPINLRAIKTEPRSSAQIFSSFCDDRTPTSSTKRKFSNSADSPQDLSNPNFSPDMSSKHVSNLPGTSRIIVTSSESAPSFGGYRNSSQCVTNSITPFTSQFNLQMPSDVITSQSNEVINNIDGQGSPFEYVMEAPKSLKQKEGEPMMSYINKGQFYCITLQQKSHPWMYKSSKVKSVVHIVFGDSKPDDEQIRHWRYWHARQHTVKQRIIDIADYKESNMIYDIEEIGHNAISFSWNVNDIARIYISCNCLSTDFSPQKGIKGLPLLLQIDTYADALDPSPIHRAQCQIKVFCDKGAERKIRDEERKANRRRKASPQQHAVSSPTTLMSLTTSDLKHAVTSSNMQQSGMSTSKKSDYVFLKSMDDLLSRPVLFTPEVPAHNTLPYPSLRTPSMSPCDSMALSPHSSTTLPSSLNESEQSYFTSQIESKEHGMKRSHSLMSSEDSEHGSICKFQRSSDMDSEKRVLLYVRRAEDEVYDGLMLKTPDLQGLKLAIEEKYKYEAEKIIKVFKKSKKGILVNMDDNIIRHYSNEDTFEIDIKASEHGEETKYTFTFTEV